MLRLKKGEQPMFLDDLFICYGRAISAYIISKIAGYRQNPRGMLAPACAMR
jgi:hypothetical protein